MRTLDEATDLAKHIEAIISAESRIKVRAFAYDKSDKDLDYCPQIQVEFECFDGSVEVIYSGSCDLGFNAWVRGFTWGCNWGNKEKAELLKTIGKTPNNEIRISREHSKVCKCIFCCSKSRN